MSNVKIRETMNEFFKSRTVHPNECEGLINGNSQKEIISLFKRLIHNISITSLLIRW